MNEAQIQLHSDTVTDKLRKALKQIGAYSRGSAVHILRHTAATELLKVKGDLRTLQEIHGHSQVSTTQIYTHIVSEQKRLVMEMLLLRPDF
jgi:site-specific recombinase XerD